MLGGGGGCGPEPRLMASLQSGQAPSQALEAMKRLLAESGLMPPKSGPARGAALARLLQTFCVALHRWSCEGKKRAGLKCLQTLLCLMSHHGRLADCAPSLLREACDRLLARAGGCREMPPALSLTLQALKRYRKLLLAELTRRRASGNGRASGRQGIAPARSPGLSRLLKHMAFRVSLAGAARDKLWSCLRSYLATETYKDRSSSLLYGLLDTANYLLAAERQAFVDFSPLSCPCEAKCFRNSFAAYCRLNGANTVIVCKACGNNLKFGDKKRDRTRIINSAYFAHDLCYFCGYDRFAYPSMYECHLGPGGYRLRAYTPNARPLLTAPGLRSPRRCKVTLYLMCSGPNRRCYNIQRFGSLQAAIDNRRQCIECRSLSSGGGHGPALPTCLDTLEEEEEDGGGRGSALVCSGCRAHIFCRCHDSNPAYLERRANCLLG